MPLKVYAQAFQGLRRVSEARVQPASAVLPSVPEGREQPSVDLGPRVSEGQVQQPASQACTPIRNKQRPTSQA